MNASELSKRYAKALYELAAENKSIDKVFNDLRALDPILSKDAETHEFLINPLIRADDRVAVLKKAIEGKGLANETQDFLLMLAANGRLGIYSYVLGAFEAQADAANNVCRGTVRSATVLDQAERQRIENTVEKVLNKKVIMTYKVDPTVIGGLVAQVGSYTFDDSIASHLRRMNEELKRRTV